MDKENFNKTFEKTIESIREYINLKTELYTLIIFERVSKMMAKFLVIIIFVFFLFFFLLFMSLGFINWFQDVTGTVLWGYAITAFFYLFLGLIIYAMRKRLFLDPMLKGFTETIFEEEDKLDQKPKNRSADEKDK